MKIILNFFSSMLFLWLFCFNFYFGKSLQPGTEAATEGFLEEKVFLEKSQNSEENTSATVSVLIKLQV